MSKYNVDGMVRTLQEVQDMKMNDPKTAVEMPRFVRLQKSECFRDIQTNTILKPQGGRLGADLRSMSVRLPKLPQQERIHSDGSGSGSRETN